MDKQISMMPTLEIRTASPFKDLFPIRETTLNEIVEDMKKMGMTMLILLLSGLGIRLQWWTDTPG